MLAGRLSRLAFRMPLRPKLLMNFSKVKMEFKVDDAIPPLNDLPLFSRTVELLMERGITSLFPIQYRVLEDVLAGVDVIAKDKTGSGKTLAYALPLTEKLRKRKEEMPDQDFQKTRKPKVLVMVPTRELAIQVYNEFENLAHDTKDHLTAAFYGGVSITEQIRKAKNQGMDVLVATPGRLIDHIERGTVDLSEIETIVLDETDEMLEIGFKEAIMKILKTVKSLKDEGNIQFLLFSATVPDWVNMAAKEFMNKPKFINMVRQEDVVIPKDIKHIMIKANNYREILNNLNSVVDSYAGIEGQTIIFTNTKRDADDIVRGRYIRANAKALHGDILQQERESIFKSFKEGKLKCLVATNVAARGLDFPAVDLIIQINPPNDVESYIHRSGRTGRAGRKGTNVLLYSQESEILVNTLKRATKIKFEVVNSFMLQELKVKSEENFRRYVKAALETIEEDQVSEYDSLVDDLIKKHGEKEALRKLVAYVVMNPLERRDVREKYKASTPMDRDQSQPWKERSMQHSSGFKPRLSEEGYDRPPRSEQGFTNFQRDRDFSEPPRDLKDSIFVSNMEDFSQVEDLKEFLEQNKIKAEIGFWRLKLDDKPGFMRLTPQTAEDYRRIMALKSRASKNGTVYFKPKKSY